MIPDQDGLSYQMMEYMHPSSKLHGINMIVLYIDYYIIIS